MFAVIDIETTGLSPTRGDRITEISIQIYDGLSVVDSFSSLVNPERSIPLNVQRLTGITNEMVAKAPKFYEIAKKVVELTRERIFVAHNAPFDYGFIVEEFKSFGYSYKREVLCTRRLARKVMSKRFSYGLKSLCEHFGIDLKGHHRAEADALATAQLLDHLLKLKSVHPVYKYQDLDELNTNRSDKIKQYILKRLPESTGVYYFLDNEKNIVYVGKSTNMRQRAIQHYQNKEAKARQMISDVFHVEYEETGSELIALILESEEIKKYKPEYNRVRKRSQFRYSIVQEERQNGIIGLRIVPYDEALQPIISFTTWLSARQKMESLINENEFCPVYCGLTTGNGTCFNFHIEKCRGVCCGQEDPDEYNARINQVLSEISLPINDFIIWDLGRNASEDSFVLVCEGKYSGYGYILKDATQRSMNELLQRIQPFTYYPDTDDLIRYWIRKEKKEGGH